MISVSCSTNQKDQSEVANEDTIEVKTPEIVGEEITYSNGTIDMIGYLVYDKNATEKRPGVLVVHEWWGHNEFAREQAHKLAELGYVALAVDMYGDGKTAAHPEDAGKFTAEVVSNMDEAISRFKEALNTLNAQPGVDQEKTAAVGYCFGGTVVLTMANAGIKLDAVAAFHAGLQLPIQPEKGKVTAKVLVCNGADDPFIPQEHTDAWIASMDAAEVDYEYVSYPGVVHSFTSKYADATGEEFDLPLAYDQAADLDSWEQMKALLNSVFDE